MSIHAEADRISKASEKWSRIADVILTTNVPRWFPCRMILCLLMKWSRRHGIHEYGLSPVHPQEDSTK